MFSYKIGLLPNAFKEMFLMTNQVHSIPEIQILSTYFLHEQI